MRKALAAVLFPLLALAVPAGAAEHGGASEKSSSKKDDKSSAVHKITQSESYLMIDPIYS